jgi:DNA-binding protein
MRYMVLAVVVAAAMCLSGATGAFAVPANGHAISQAVDHSSFVTDVAGGCGRGWHRNRWGRCVP